MRRSILFILALPVMLAGVVMAASPALATSPHFVSANGTLNSDGSLTVNFKEAGLGDNVLVHYTLAAPVSTATWVCVNKGGANPSAQNKTTVSGPDTVNGAFMSGKNGNITANLTLEPLPSDISCPSGQKLELASVTYGDSNHPVTLTDTDNNQVADLGFFSSGCLLTNVRGAC